MIQIVGGGLAGCEAAWQAAELGVDVTIHEMRPGPADSLSAHYQRVPPAPILTPPT